MEYKKYIDFKDFKIEQEKSSKVKLLTDKREAYNLDVESIKKEINRINAEVSDLKQKIKILKDKDVLINENSKDVIKIYDLMTLKQKLNENVKKIQDIFNEKKEDLIYIQENIATSQNFPNIKSLEKSKLSILRLELNHLKREENSYREKIMNIETTIILNYRKNNLRKNEYLKIKQELATLQYRLLRKEKMLNVLITLKNSKI